MITVRDLIKRDEGLRLKPYTDTRGNLSIGYGHNLTALGISQADADVFLDQDLARAEADLVRAYPIVLALDAARQGVLTAMCFNLGLPHLQTFVQLWRAIEARDFVAAAAAMRASRWAAQVGDRAIRLAAAMATGELI